MQLATKGRPALGLWTSTGYRETDVISTYRIWLIYELFRGNLTRAEFQASEAHLLSFIRERVATKPHLLFLMGDDPASGS